MFIERIMNFGVPNLKSNQEGHVRGKFLPATMTSQHATTRIIGMTPHEDCLHLNLQNCLLYRYLHIQRKSQIPEAEHQTILIDSNHPVVSIQKHLPETSSKNIFQKHLPETSSRNIFQNLTRTFPALSGLDLPVGHPWDVGIWLQGRLIRLPIEGDAIRRGICLHQKRRGGKLHDIWEWLN